MAWTAFYILILAGVAVCAWAPRDLHRKPLDLTEYKRRR